MPTVYVSPFAIDKLFIHTNLVSAPAMLVTYVDHPSYLGQGSIVIICIASCRSLLHPRRADPSTVQYRSLRSFQRQASRCTQTRSTQDNSSDLPFLYFYYGHRWTRSYFGRFLCRSKRTWMVELDFVQQIGGWRRNEVSEEKVGRSPGKAPPGGTWVLGYLLGS